ncbi:hypothetical protein E6O75_ATG06419 [Venturia nashicola]|uniref:Uncharacterized protein n=1 Tax=Venturia nashicola TaxID=86259 RepID=A0A4Z1NXS1_9PEZI|nr:hypothetical protein E6O75_ATG06419 [Venturia nashicola]
MIATFVSGVRTNHPVVGFEFFTLPHKPACLRENQKSMGKQTFLIDVEPTGLDIRIREGDDGSRCYRQEDV